MSTTLRETSQYPIPQRVAIGFFRRVSRSFTGVFRDIGYRVFFVRDILRALGDPATYLPQTLGQMYAIGVESVPLTVITAAFLGAVSAFQTVYQLFPGVALSVVAFISRQSIILELGPLLTGLVLAGRVGARMTAEIGTMRVTEQIDALETLAYDPIAYLVVPRLLACLVMLPMLTILANATAILSAFVTSVAATAVTVNDFREGVRLGYDPFQIVYSMIKALLYGGAIALVGTYEGYVTGAGAEGVGKSTAKTVVISAVTILVLDSLVAAHLSRFIQG